MVGAPVSPARRWLRRLALGVAAVLVFMLGFPALYAVVARDTRLAAPSLPVPPAAAYDLYVVDWGYHTAIVVEQPPGWRLGPPGEEAAPLLEYAWGDRRFYLESDYRPHSLFATIALPTASVAYLDGLSSPDFRGARAVFRREVDSAVVRALFAELERSIRRGPDGVARAPSYPVAVGYGGRFFPAHGAYLWTQDCNWWTVARLQAVGLADSPAGVILTRQVPARLKGFARLR